MNNNDNENRKTKRKGYEYLILLLLTISLFITATYAWFTDSAFSKGNKVFAGNLYIDILADAEDLEEKYETSQDFITWKGENTSKTIQDYLIEVLGCESYTRKYKNPNPDGDEYITERYYITTGTEAGGINLYNMEPGQVRKLDVKYVNTGDLAFKAGGALKFDYDDTTGEPKSYTGLETLNQQKEQETEIYRNNYAVGKPTIDVFYTTGSPFENDDRTDYIELKVYFENKTGSESITVEEIKNLPILEIEVIKSKGIYSNFPELYEQLHDEYIGKTMNEIIDGLLPTYDENWNDEEKASYYYKYSLYIAYWNMVIYLFDYQPANVTAGKKEIEGSSGTNTIDPKLISKGEDVNGNDYSYYSAAIENIDDKEYEYRFKKLVNLQAEKDEYGNPKKYDSSYSSNTEYFADPTDANTYYKDEGGHLEEVLEVYVIPNANKTKSNASAEIVEGGKQPQVLPEIIEEDTKKDSISTIDHDIFTNKENKLHDEYYFGNLEQFTFLMDNGAIADKEFVLDSRFDTLDKLKDITDHDYSIEEEYILLKQDLKANLYEDYQRYLGNVGGYCLPKDAVTKDDKVTLPHKDGIDVVIYDENGTHNQRYSEMGECDIYLYMPTTADSRYQNAYISLSIGATATQVEYEMDDTGYMLYDKFEYKNNDEDDDDEDEEIINGDIIKINCGDNENAQFRVLNVEDDTLSIIPITTYNNGQYQSDDPIIDFNSLSNGHTLVLSGFDYNQSSLKQAVDMDIAKIRDRNNALYEKLNKALVPVATTQYVFESEIELPSFDPILTSNSLNNQYTLIDSLGGRYVFTRLGYNDLGELKVRALSLTDIFEALNSLEEEFTPENIVKLITNNDASEGSHRQTPIQNISLMDTDGTSFYIVNSANGNIGSYDLSDVEQQFIGEFVYVPVYNVDISKLERGTDYDFVENFGGNDDDKIKIGVASNVSSHGTITRRDVCVNALLSVLTEKELSSKYKVVDKYIVTNGLISLDTTASDIQYENIKTLINDDLVKYLIVEPIDNKYTSDIQNLAESKDVEVFFVGNDYINTSYANDAKTYPYLARPAQYIKAINGALIEYFPSYNNLNIDYSVLYNSNNVFQASIGNAITSTPERAFAGFNKNQNVININTIDQDYTNKISSIFSGESNVVLADDLGVIVSVNDNKSMDYEYGPLYILYYYENIPGMVYYAVDFSYYQISYDYDTACSSVVDAITAHEEGKPIALPKNLNLVTYELIEPRIY